jgi:hypothetical protein
MTLTRQGDPEYVADMEEYGGVWNEEEEITEYQPDELLFYTQQDTNLSKGEV